MNCYCPVFQWGTGREACNAQRMRVLLLITMHFSVDASPPHVWLNCNRILIQMTSSSSIDPHISCRRSSSALSSAAAAAAGKLVQSPIVCMKIVQSETSEVRCPLFWALGQITAKYRNFTPNPIIIIIISFCGHPLARSAAVIFRTIKTLALLGSDSNNYMI